ncbi:ABC transporter substrate-binding protein [Acrocarpospora macrocephala]|uniref:Peptide ABC transporter n=1 Tax=Acrocarpospora macrocephala TaxID=150177 RepID=A0A5M3WT30_9ACTN|nr:peptide ABC transporter [Acrocarpospora macrocephala]
MGVALIAPLAACTSSPGTEPTDGEPVKGGTLTYLINQATITLDPAVSPGNATALMTRNIFDSLVVQTEPGTFKPWLATSWTISEDGTVYTFELKDGVKFHDGTPFTAEAVKAALDHIVDPETKSQNTILLGIYDHSRVIDDLTVEVTLSQPFRPFLETLSGTELAIQSPAQLALPAADYKPVGTGPFSYVSWDQQKMLVLDRNPDYSSPPTGAAHEGPAYLEQLRFDLVTEDATRYGALTNGEAQAIAAVPAADVETLTSTAGFQVLTASVPGVNYSLFFNSSRGLTSGLRIRQALQAATDVPAIVKNVYFGTYEVATNVLGPATASYDASAANSLQGYDPDKAVHLLEEAGWTETNADGYRTKDGQELELVWPSYLGANTIVPEAVQADAKKVGIKITRPNVDVATVISRLESGDYDIMDGNISRSDPDVLRDAFNSERSYAVGGWNLSRVNSDELDQWLDAGLTTNDQDVADKSYAQVQKKVLADAHVLPIFVYQYILGASDALHGVTFGATAQPLLYDAWLSE